MSLPTDTCLAMEIDISSFLDLAINLPGGMTLNATLEPGQFPNLSVIVGSLLKPLNAALAPLAPFFNLLDLVMKIVKFTQAVPDALGPPPDPTKIASALAAVLKAAAKVANLIPPLSVPIMVVGICKVISAALLAFITELEFQIDQATKLDLAQQKADALANDPDTLAIGARLAASIDCARADLDTALAIGSNSLGPLNKFIDLINTFLDLAGLPKKIRIGAVAGGGADPSSFLDPMKTAVEAIATICGSIPV